MATRNTTTPAPAGVSRETAKAGPALALSVLYEANDLLNILREHGNENPDLLGAAQWTMTTEISRRLNSAIAQLDDNVPHPADDDVDDANARQPEGTGGLERGQYALLVADGIRGITSGILGIAETLAGPLYDDMQDENAQRLVDALQQLARRLNDAADVPFDLHDKVSAVLEAPDSGVEAMSKRLREKGLYLWSDPTTANVFGVSDRNFSRMEMSICSLDEIDRNLLARAENGHAHE